VNDLPFVLRAVDLLKSHGVRTWLCGSWAEDLRGLRPPGRHGDLDLLYPARDWGRVDTLRLDWMDGRKLPWMRSFVLEGTMVELFLVERDARGWFTRLGQRRHGWPDDVFATNGRVGVASAAALAGFRTAYRRAA
jgi:hypothetical protein